jgi:hypothetical protein
LLETVLAVQVALLLDEADVNELALATWVHAEEVSWTPGLAQGGDKRSSEGGEKRVKKGSARDNSALSRCSHQFSMRFISPQTSRGRQTRQ